MKTKLVGTVEVDGLKLNFRCRKGCELQTQEMVEVAKEYHGSVKRALYDIKILLKANAPKELDVLVKNRILVPGEPGKAVKEAAGLFSVLCPNVIELSASCIDEFKAGCEDLETAHLEMMKLFLNELAHWAIGHGEEETDDLAYEWMLASKG